MVLCSAVILPNVAPQSPNIPLSATSTSPLAIPHPHTHYIPPHPQQGTPYHRYVVLLLPQASPTEPIKLPNIPEAERLGFNFRAFADEHGFDGSKGGGAHMWREVWDETVSKIYRDVLSEYFLYRKLYITLSTIAESPEPRYGRPRMYDPYAEVKHGKKYI